MALCQTIYTEGSCHHPGQGTGLGVCLFTKMATLPGTAVTTTKTEATLARLYKDIPGLTNCLSSYKLSKESTLHW